jgi:6-phosphogluconate dehydrogenase (decarboxylating)
MNHDKINMRWLPGGFDSDEGRWTIKAAIDKQGDDMPEITEWRWGHREKAAGLRARDTAGNNI